MLLDQIGAIALTAASAAVIGMLAAALPLDTARRAQAAIALFAWFAAVVALGATGALDADTGLGPAGVGIAVALPFAVLAVAGAHPRLLASAIEALPVELLIGVNALRIFGLFFILLHAAGRLPDPFASSAGWGDVIVGITALPVALLARAKVRGWRAIAWAWNSFALLDLVVAVSLGITSSPGSPLRIFYAEPGAGIMSGLPWLLIPGFLVPLYALTHLAVFARLRSAAHERPVHAQWGWR
jgi:hypothetical protein